MATTEGRVTFPALREAGGVQVSRSPWGPDDELGRLNWLEELGLSRVLAECDGGKTFDLTVSHSPEIPLGRPFADPAFELRGAPLTVQQDRGAVEPHTDHVSMLVHVGTHIDSLQHVGYCGAYWNGHDPAEKLAYLGGTSAADKFPPIVARGVLLDVAGLHGVDVLPGDHAISADEVRACSTAQGVELRRGDVVLVRTGCGSRWPSPEYMRFPIPGLGLDGARYLCEETGAMAIGADNVALEPVLDGRGVPVHVYMFLTAGAPIIEILDLEELAAERVHTFAFLGFPLKLHAATGSPIRAAAIPLRRG